MFSEFETALIEKIKSHFGQHLREVGVISGALSEETFKNQNLKLPGVFVRFIGFDSIEQFGSVKTKWAIFTIVDYSTNRSIKTKGNSKKLGIYNIVEQLVMLLNKAEINSEEAGRIATVTINRGTELFTNALDKKGLVLWSMEIEATTTLKNIIEENTLDDFETFDATYTEDEQTLAHDQLKLEQENEESND